MTIASPLHCNPRIFVQSLVVGNYLWGNRAIAQLAGEEVVGKTDCELVWAANAEALQATDKQVWETRSPTYLQEIVDNSSRGKATLNVCKWLGEFEGRDGCFGISFTIE